jgi:hypothetical protein
LIFGGSAFRGGGFGDWGFCTDVCAGGGFGGSAFLGSGLVCWVRGSDDGGPGCVAGRCPGFGWVCGGGGVDFCGVVFTGVGFPGVTFAGSGLGVGLGVGFGVGIGVGIGVGRGLGCSAGFATTAGRRGGSVVGAMGRLGVDLGIGVAVFVASVFGTATLAGLAVAATGVGGVTSLGDCDPVATDSAGGCGRVAPVLRAVAPGSFGGVVAVGAAAPRG